MSPQKTLTFAEAKRACNEYGYTLKRTGWGKEVAVDRYGHDKNHPETYFTDDLDDAVDTARSMAVRAIFGIKFE